MQDLSSPESNTVAAAVELLWPEYRRWVGVRNKLLRLARDPTSRLSGIRDAVLWVLPDYLPDPRRRQRDLDTVTDAAAFAKFIADHCVAGHLQMALMKENFPKLPTRFDQFWLPCHRIKFHSGAITIMGLNRTVTYKDGRIVWQSDEEMYYCGNGVFANAGCTMYIVDGIRYQSLSNFRNCIGLPCGLVLEYTVEVSSARIVNLQTNQCCNVTIEQSRPAVPSRKLRMSICDDFGYGECVVGGDDRVGGAVPGYACITY